ncbi:DUF2062 domain-containing protein [Zoogloea sp.]|jgi:uncharacterized protein (DUF2062 family)|uniref:DUF2062 domain-containing protein n=1 Tax=Zoogloea sp. TaxID=49181 RepID=UPI001B47CDE5|nr:DUF2062 domain-containing protein [Zoogloea sp.]MBK6652683.1 DUF2062 domain-containing protein [Zoogloea sp.]MBP7445386.1 DUF2062 domain-containing protein [Zoogloea sp.]
MRRLLKRYLPDHASLATNRWLAPFGSTLFHPRLWHLNRHSAAGAIATGLFCGLIPGPFQMLGAALGCVLLRVNLPLALLTTLYTNPFTIVPLYILAFSMGEALLGRGEARFTPPPEWSGGDVLGGVAALADWMIALGRPLALGLVVLATSLALAGYLLTRIAWRTYLIHHWRKRRQR